MPEDAKVYLKEKGERETLEQYLIGLEWDLQHQVRSTSPKDLRTEIEKAIDMEQRTSARLKEVKTQDSPTEVITIRRAPAREVCSHCGRGNHKEDCWRKNTDVRVCDFCNRRGHLYGDCTTLRQALRNRKITLEIIRKGSEAAQVTNPPQVVYASYPAQPIAPLPYATPPIRPNEGSDSRRQ